jgi:hypothetical protein
MRTSELEGAALDWAVAKCEGLRSYIEVVEGFKPSTDWTQGGSIIERECIEIRFDWAVWKASMCLYENTPHKQLGSTPLIAAMRCYVASKLGDEVDVPNELKGEVR